MLRRGTGGLITTLLPRRGTLTSRPIISSPSLVRFSTVNRHLKDPSLNSAEHEKPGEQVEELRPTVEVETVKGAESVPWYLRDEESSKLDQPIFKAEMPDLPESIPPSLEPILRYMINKLGLQNFKVFDIRDSENEELPISSYADIMVISEGKSEKHLQNASQDLITYLKNDHDVFPFVEGLVKPNSMARLRRRMKRRIINRKTTLKDEEFGVGANSWVMIDTKIDNVFIHLLTPERREQLNLEYLWCKPEDRYLWKPKIEIFPRNGREVFDVDESDSIFSGLKRHYSTLNSENSLEQNVLRQIQIQNTHLEPEVIESIKSDPSMSSNIMRGIITNLENLTKDSMTPELLIEYSLLMESIFPYTPSYDHWNLTYDFFFYAQYLDDENFRFRNMAITLKLQAASGLSITKDQFKKYLESINMGLSSERRWYGDKLEYGVALKFDLLFRILRIVEINNPDIFDDEELVLEVLRIPTQQHLFDSAPNNITLGYQSKFKVLFDFFYGDGLRKPSLQVVELALMTYLRSNNIIRFYKFWDSLLSSKEEENILILDDRPWLLILKIILLNYKESVVEVLVHEKLPMLVKLGFQTDEELKKTVTEILDKFDESGKSYSQLREYFK